MITELENEVTKIEVDTAGAQLQSFILKADNKDYLWSGDAKYWKRKAPVLFPIVGRLKNNTYNYAGKEYEMSQHGFARDMEFELIEHSAQALTYSLKATAETLKIYPFQFELLIKYQLEKNKLKISYQVNNQDEKEMYFSIGAHPAFNWPLSKDETKSDYVLEFEHPENAARYLLADGLLTGSTKPMLVDSKTIKLKADLFENDALVFKNLKSEIITFRSRSTEREVKIEFAGFPYLGIWSQSIKAPFICLEPWHGVADIQKSSGNLTEKIGIKSLAVGETFKTGYTISIK